MQSKSQKAEISDASGAPGVSVPSHTPTPWRVDPRRSLRVLAGDDDTVASVGCQASLNDQWHANAAFIVRAINSHDALVKALEQIRDGLADTGSTRGQWMTRITKADAHRIADAALASSREVRS